ncbi:hypothetical protein BC827DRAFT_1312585 [Russula dissimulans]|nr:hypothetical protein BC827DRAFT_1312585 [Russula dissimulans]
MLKRLKENAFKDFFDTAPKLVHEIPQAPPGWREMGVLRAQGLCNPGVRKACYRMDRDQRFAKEREERNEARRREARWERKGEGKIGSLRWSRVARVPRLVIGSRKRLEEQRQQVESNRNGDMEGYISLIRPSRMRTQSLEPHIPLANTGSAKLSEDDVWRWGNNDNQGPNVNITRNAWSATNADLDEVDEMRSVASAGTSSTSFTTGSGFGHGGGSSLQLPQEPCGPPSSRTTTLSIQGSNAQFPLLEQRRPKWDACSGRSNPVDPLLLSRPNPSASVHSAANSLSDIVVPADPIAATHPSRAGHKKRSSTASNSGTESPQREGRSRTREAGPRIERWVGEERPPISDRKQKNVKTASVNMCMHVLVNVMLPSESIVDALTGYYNCVLDSESRSESIEGLQSALPFASDR